MGSPDISPEIQRLIEQKLADHNRERSPAQGQYIVVAPREGVLYFSLWYQHPEAAHYPYIYLFNLELNALSSVESAMQEIANSFLPLAYMDALTLPPDQGDDIILFGKYRGYHLWEIYRIDPHYIQWIAEKFEVKTRNDHRFKELAISYNKVFLDLKTGKNYKKSASQFVGAVGEKLTNLHLKIVHVRFEDDSYRTRTIDSIVHYYVDQLITAVDKDDNRFFLTIKAADRSLNSQVVATGSHIYTPGEYLHLLSAKVLKQYISHHTQYTKLGYLKFKQQ